MSDKSAPKDREWVQQPRRTLVRLLAVCVSVGVSCGILYVSIRLLLAAGVIPTPSLWLFEESGHGVVFDAITGFRLGDTPTRVLRITNGEIEYRSEMRGNDMGFPDADDFFPRRPEEPPGLLRYAVLGDSFSANMVVKTPWCEVAENQAAAGGRPVELLNFSLDGIGLASWHGVVTRILEPQGYQLDGVVFAVFPSDLRRRLTFWDHSTGNRPRLGRWPNWDTKTYPRSLTEVQPLLEEQSAFIVSRGEFEKALAGDWNDFLMPALRHTVIRWVAGRRSRPKTEAGEAGRRRTIAEIASALDRIGVRRRIVVHVPSRESLLVRDTRVPDMTRDFAKQIGAELWNGSDAFEALAADEVRALWLPHDGHWAQPGADRFATWFTGQLVLNLRY